MGLRSGVFIVAVVLLACSSGTKGDAGAPGADGGRADAETAPPADAGAPECTRDSQCARGPCAYVCQGDGRPACLPSRCELGRCVAPAPGCDIEIEGCPPGTRADTVCAECTPEGSGCALFVIGCHDVCDAPEDCPTGQPCVEGLCAWAACD